MFFPLPWAVEECSSTAPGSGGMFRTLPWEVVGKFLTLPWAVGNVTNTALRSGGNVFTTALGSVGMLFEQTHVYSFDTFFQTVRTHTNK